MAICCEVEAVNYVETSAAREDNSEALQLCALATMKQQINNNNNNFRRSPSIQVGPTHTNTRPDFIVTMLKLEEVRSTT